MRELPGPFFLCGFSEREKWGEPRVRTRDHHSEGSVKLYATVCISLLMTISAAAKGPRQNSSAQSATQASPQNQASADELPDIPAALAKIDPGKAADIRRLEDVMGIRAQMETMPSPMMENVRPTLRRSLPPGDYREKLIDLFLARLKSNLSLDTIIDLATINYDKYFSDQDIKDLTAFYETPLGKRTLTVVPQITVKLTGQGMRVGEVAGRKSMAEVLEENPDIAKALEEANKANSK
jgi:hypothetical protein